MLLYQGIIILLNQGLSYSSDLFEYTENWSIIKSDQVQVITSSATGKMGKCLQVDINFVAGSGYGGVQISYPQILPENFQFSFYLKSNLPVNNLEFKLIDQSGDNVWWYNQRNFEFPTKWKKITIKKRNIEFAWGPVIDKSLGAIEKLEIIIASVNGGKGVFYLDEFKFDELNPPNPDLPQPLISSSSQIDDRHSIAMISDGELSSIWRSTRETDNQEVLIDCHQYREFGGLVIDWDDLDFARQYAVHVSNDRKHWDQVYTVTSGAGGRRYLYLRDCDSRYIKLKLEQSSRRKGYGIREIELKNYEFARSPEAFFQTIAADKPRGLYPRYLLDEQNYWTITGPPDDDNEALISEDGAVEADRRSFSLEPFVFCENILYSWANTTSSQSLEESYIPVPSVKRHMNDLVLEIKLFAEKIKAESRLYIIYTLENNRTASVQGNFYIAIRPLQVNPPWQFLNNRGGTSQIKSIKKRSQRIVINSDKSVYTITKPQRFGATEFDSGDICEFLQKNELPPLKNITDHFGYASGAMRYTFDLRPGESYQVFLAIPWEDSPNTSQLSQDSIKTILTETIEYWKNKLNTVQFDLPLGADRLINTIRSNLAYILINRDGAGIQPGSRSYERSWIRDGSLTSSALLKMGIQREPREFVEWYASYQYDNGKIPCVVDRRGPDPVPENDSHGQYIFALLQYYNYTKNKAFLAHHFDSICKTIQYMEYLSAQRRTITYAEGNPIQQACYGLMPESISHEGYSAKPMHSYWDDFFALKGYKDAVEIARILGKKEYEERWTIFRDRFRKDLYKSIDRAMSNKKIDFIPGCVELGDFDATSTAIAVYPCNELKNLPMPQIKNTFDRYFTYFSNRCKTDFAWRDYTPYEVRLIGTYLYLGQKERAHKLIDFFFNDQRPAAWNHWAEVVRKGYRTPGFIGDMPHSWVGSDFINATRSLFVYEDEIDESLVIGRGLYDEWIDHPEGMSVGNLPTYYGLIDYSVIPLQNGYKIILGGSIELPENGIKVSNFKNKFPSMVRVNDQKHTFFNGDFVRIDSFPAEIDIIY